MPFCPSQVKKFYFSAYRFDAASATVVLEYAFDTGERFVEILYFPGTVLPLFAPP
jgi:hypothetical protein